LRERGRVQTTEGGEVMKTLREKGDALERLVENVREELKEERLKRTSLQVEAEELKKEVQQLRGEALDKGELDRLRAEDGASKKLRDLEEKEAKLKQRLEEEQSGRQKERERAETAEESLRLEKAARAEEGRVWREREG